MKNKNLLITLSLFFFTIFNNFTIADEFNYESSEILLSDNGNKVRGINGVNLTSDTGIKISGQQFDYNKLNSILNVQGNVVVQDELSDLTLKAEELTYLKLIETIYTKKKSIIRFNNKYSLSSNEITYDRKKKINIF